MRATLAINGLKEMIIEKLVLKEMINKGLRFQSEIVGIEIFA